ncbi:Prenylcysteine lyase-domain-containing protein [Tricharina praecox]|uniref:Prenylcysteine lyase-domain-containing protein n=1 Tax=Tricharina praecox TaxID=43433 RepID=UPI00221F0CF4|nr:Prenylcysteine lyase-domain-containing protein [Tricharina praecox]KAI5855313.1 Prenylcysteine lyase-domain-containing protein [Tricharina praecox]
MASHRRRRPITIIVLLVALCLFVHSAEAGFLSTLRQKVLALTLSDGNEAPTAVPDQAVVEKKPKREGKRVAIIGAGAAGSSSAYYLRKYLANSTVSGLPVEITVFDKHAYVGGRSTTVNAYDDPSLPIELGASIFVSINHNLVNAAAEFGLSVSSVSNAPPTKEAAADVLGVYDGTDFVFTFPEGSWWTLAKLFYKYGPTSPYRTKKLTDAVVGKFLAMYQAPLFPFRSLSSAVEAAGLLPAVGTTGEQFLQQNGISTAFAQDLIQASTRVNYGQNLGLIHGLETMVCMATDGAVSVQGGNWRIFEGMVQHSAVDLRLQTAVTKLERNDDAGEWIVTSQKDGSPIATSEVYDEVIVAGPWQYSVLSVLPPLAKTPDTIPFVTLHVTLFASPRRLDPGYFHLPPGTAVPQAVITTLNATERADPDLLRGEGVHAVGNTGFFSISTLRTVVRPSGQTEHVYKVFSPARFGDDRVRAIIGATAEEEGMEGMEEQVTWLHRHIWKSYPYVYPRVTFDETKLANGLWYTGAVEAFISTMETSSLMGMNVAKLMVDEWDGEKREKEEKEKEAVVEAAAAEEAAAAAETEVEVEMETEVPAIGEDQPVAVDELKK